MELTFISTITCVHKYCASKLNGCPLPEQTLNSMFNILRMGDFFKDIVPFQFKIFLLFLFAVLLYFMKVIFKDFRKYGPLGTTMYLRFEVFCCYLLYTVLIIIFGSNFALLMFILELFRHRMWIKLICALAIALVNNSFITYPDSHYTQNQNGYFSTETPVMITFCANGFVGIISLALNIYQGYMLNNRILSHLPAPLIMSPLPNETVPNESKNDQPTAPPLPANHVHINNMNYSVPTFASYQNGGLPKPVPAFVTPIQ